MDQIGIGESVTHGPPDVPPDAIREQVERILASDGFLRSRRIKSFLRFVVEETLAGRADRLKAYTIGLEVFGRDESFDPSVDPIVRVEAGRLRQRLKAYYLEQGRDDPIEIEIPKGGYVPTCRLSPGAAPAAPSSDGLDLPTGPSIAVLPFDNMCGEAGQDYFVDGLVEEIINDLTKFRDLLVISRNTTFQYKGRHVDVRRLGRDLGVGYVLEGSVRKAANRIRVTAQLLETVNGAHVFSETYDRDLTPANIIDVQDEIADHVVTAIAQPYGAIARVDLRDAKRKATESLDAYDSVLHFYEYWATGGAEAHLMARDALERAVTLDPQYASAWAALAQIYADEGRFGYNSRPGRDPFDRALEAARKAIELDPDNCTGYQALFVAYFHKHDIDQFRATGERALALNPNDPNTLADYGLMLAFTGDWDRGVALTRKAIALSPVHPGWYHAAAIFDHYRKGEYEAALAEAKQGEMEGFYITHVFSAMAYGQLGRQEEAQAAIENLLALRPDFANTARDEFRRWNLAEDLIDHCLDGLRKAGLGVSDRTS